MNVFESISIENVGSTGELFFAYGLLLAIVKGHRELSWDSRNRKIDLTGGPDALPDLIPIPAAQLRGLTRFVASLSRIAPEGEGPWHGAFLIRVGDGLLVVNTSITGARLDRRVTLRIDDGELPVAAAKSVLQDISRAQTTITIFGPDDRRQVCINLTRPQASRNSQSWWRRTETWLIDVIDVFVSAFMISRLLDKVWCLLNAQGAERDELQKETRLILDSWMTPSWISTVAEKDGREADWHTALGLVYYAYTIAADELS